MKKIVCFNILLIIILTLIASCTSTTLTRVWKEPTFVNTPLNNIMVMGLAEKEVTRELFEDLFVDQFRKLDIKSEASHNIISPDSQLTRENIKDHKEIIKQTAEQNQLGTVLITHLVSVTEEEVELESSGAGGEVLPFMADLDQYYTYSLTHMTAPSRSVVRTYVRLQTSIFDTATEKRIWSAASETVDPKSVDRVIKELINAIMDQLASDNML